MPPDDVPAIDHVLPGGGKWRVQNSPADRIPSHGTAAFASSHAIDLTPVDDRGVSGAITLATLVRPEAPERFVGFGRPLWASVDGTVVAVEGEVPDHLAFRGLPSVAYMLGQGRRARGGWRAVAGNHVVIATAHGRAFVAVCHLQRRSLRVRVGDRVRKGDVIGACGNSGNSTEPHVHVQAMTSRDPLTAESIRFTLDGELPPNGRIVGDSGQVDH